MLKITQTFTYKLQLSPVTVNVQASKEELCADLLTRAKCFVNLCNWLLRKVTMETAQPSE